MSAYLLYPKYMKSKKQSGMLKKTVIGLAIATTIGATFWVYTNNGVKIPLPSYQVKRVIDGDTFETTEKQIIRLSSTDAPELNRCDGPEAKKALEQLIVGKPLYLKVQYRDDYRLISVVFTDEGSVNEAMVRSGHANYRKTGGDMGQEMLDASEEARAYKRGIHSDRCTQIVNTQNSDCQIKGNNRVEKIYFPPNCGNHSQVQVQLWDGDEWFCTEQEAVNAGYRRSQQCPSSKPE